MGSSQRRGPYLLLLAGAALVGLCGGRAAAGPRQRASGDAWRPARATPLIAAPCIPLDCDDQNPCTADRCDPVAGCVHEVPGCFDDVRCALGRDRDVCARVAKKPAQKKLARLVGQAVKLITGAQVKLAGGKVDKAALLLARAAAFVQKGTAKAAALQGQGKTDDCVAALGHDRSDLQTSIGELRQGVRAGLPACAQGQCGNGKKERGEECDGADLGGLTCASGDFDGGTLSCDQTCRLDTTGCRKCGNSRAEPGEDCDGLDLRQATCASVSPQFAGGVLGCASCRFDVSGCLVRPGCGNALIDPPEECDGANLNQATCVSLGYDGGMLACDQACRFDTSSCRKCGNGKREPGEVCDGSDIGTATCPAPMVGTPLCTTTCTLDLSPCHERVCGDGITDSPEECENPGGAMLGNNCGCCRSRPMGHLNDPQNPSRATEPCMSCHALGQDPCMGPCIRTDSCSDLTQPPCSCPNPPEPSCSCPDPPDPTCTPPGCRPFPCFPTCPAP